MAPILFTAAIEFKDSYHASSRIEVAVASLVALLLFTAPAATLLLFPMWMATFPSPAAAAAPSNPYVFAALSVSSAFGLLLVALVCVAAIGLHAGQVRFGFAKSAVAIATVIAWGVVRSARDAFFNVSLGTGVPAAIEPVAGSVGVAIVVASRLLIHPDRTLCCDIGAVVGFLATLGGGVLRLASAGWSTFDPSAQSVWLLVGASAADGVVLVLAAAFIHRMSLPRAAFALGGYQQRLHAQSPSSTVSGRGDVPLVIVFLLSLGWLSHSLAMPCWAAAHGGLIGTPVPPSEGYVYFARGWRCVTTESSGTCGAQNGYFGLAFMCATVCSVIASTVTARFSAAVAIAGLQLAWPLSAILRLSLPRNELPASWLVDVRDRNDRLGFVLGNLTLSLVALFCFVVSELYARGSAGVLERQLDENASERSPLHRRHHQYDHYL